MNEELAGNPDVSGQQPPQPPATPRKTWLALLTVIGIVVLFVAMCVLPTFPHGRQASRRAQCSQNLKQIGLALLNYEYEYGRFPPAYTVDAAGKPLHSWRTLILPYLEQQDLYNSIDLTKPWDDPINQKARDTRIGPYACPSAGVATGKTTYLAIVTPASVMRMPESMGTKDISDDPNLTLLVMEYGDERAVHWMAPMDASEEMVVRFAASDQLPHPGGVQSVMASGVITFLVATKDEESLRALVTAVGNDDDIADPLD
jgi:hypothetical protein